MSQDARKEKEEIITELVKAVNQKIPENQVNAISEFATQFFNTASLDDLMVHDIETWYGVAMSLWHFIYHREPNQLKINIYNPNFEQHGWQCTHTIIQIVTDDMPFLVDSVRMEIDKHNLTTHMIIHTGRLQFTRSAKHEINEVLPAQSSATFEPGITTKREAVLFLEIDRQTSQQVIDTLTNKLHHVLNDVRAVVTDWPVMREQTLAAIEDLDKVAKHLDPLELQESKDFLHWLEDHHFTFLGVRDYELVKEGDNHLLRIVPKSSYGVLSDTSESAVAKTLESMTPEAQKLTLSSQILIISKTMTLSTVHRAAYTDYIGIKRFDKNGKVIGERRLLGLYTSSAYNSRAKSIPFLRSKVKQVLDWSNLGEYSHAGKVLANILENLPRDDLFQASAEELLELGLGIFHMQERRRIRLFLRKDVYGRFISCLVYVPKERVNAELRFKIESILAKTFNATEINYSTTFLESILALMHFIVRLDPASPPTYDVKLLESQLIQAGKVWDDSLRDDLVDYFGEEKGMSLYHQFHSAFPASYRERFNTLTAVFDVKHVEKLSPNHPLEMNFYRPIDELSGLIRFKVYQWGSLIPLSDVLPILENLGLRVISEQPYQLTLQNGQHAWINDFAMTYCGESELDLDSLKENFQQAFHRVWANDAENDGLNRLILAAGLNWREVMILRAYTRYLRQIKFTFSQVYMEQTLSNHPHIVQKLLALFHGLFNPHAQLSPKAIEHLESELLKELEAVQSLDDDRILRRFMELIKATLRTNYYQQEKDGNPKNYLALKLSPTLISDMPLPRPLYEVFVYSRNFEGIHLRGAKVARGGLRWSDRPEDFRTEILGLMKAQQVKNAVIVPSGAKGGFVPRALVNDASREAIFEYGVVCYKNFIGALLDVTDNIVGETIVPPTDVVRYDGDDPYLVVAADKGTATFSDTANAIALARGFWLGDAFASGGSAGYDHKKMGITAKGAWESVKRHFRELGQNCQKETFTAIGIGDLAGDVFGNGVLLSPVMKLVAAFNHIHIFVDPNPDPKTSFAERTRMFNLPRSSWTDYDSNLISAGGGVFLRSAKSIRISKEMQQLFGITAEHLPPNELIRAILKSPVDLLWNGGIGTFVKSENETHLDVGDKANDAIRINANELQARVVGEGGNLGFTQKARVEITKKGGRIYTDFIDNSAGVDCSDHEVNIKILLNTVVKSGDLTEKQRNQLLAEMTDEVAQLVLRDNYQQTQAISLATYLGPKNIELHIRYIADLEAQGLINRELESLPDEKTLLELKQSGMGMTAPSIAVLLAYSKILLKTKILESDVPEDPVLAEYLERAFPKVLAVRYQKEMQAHSLRREIIATQLSNGLINEMGFTFIYRLQDETGASEAAIVRAYTVVREIFDLDKIWADIEALDNIAPCDIQHKLMVKLIRLLRRAARWILRHRRMSLDIAQTIKEFAPGVAELKQLLMTPEISKEANVSEEAVKQFMDVGVTESLARQMASLPALLSALDIVAAASEYQIPIRDMAIMFYRLGAGLEISWLRNQVISHSVDNHWEALSREAVRDDLDWQQRQLTIAVLLHPNNGHTNDEKYQSWLETYDMLIARWQKLLGELRSTQNLNFTMYFVAVRELLDLTQTSTQQLLKTTQILEQDLDTEVKTSDNQQLTSKIIKRKRES